jgi:hypothetical protein
LIREDEINLDNLEKIKRKSKDIEIKTKLLHKIDNKIQNEIFKRIIKCSKNFPGYISPILGAIKTQNIWIIVGLKKDIDLTEYIKLKNNDIDLNTCLDILYSIAKSIFTIQQYGLTINFFTPDNIFGYKENCGNNYLWVLGDLENLKVLDFYNNSFSNDIFYIGNLMVKLFSNKKNHPLYTFGIRLISRSTNYKIDDIIKHLETKFNMFEKCRCSIPLYKNYVTDYSDKFT